MELFKRLLLSEGGMLKMVAGPMPYEEFLTQARKRKMFVDKMDRDSPDPSKLHQGKPVSLHKESGAWHYELYRHDDDGLTMIGVVNS